MLRALHLNRSAAGLHPSRRRQIQFVPSIPGAVACLEDRTLLSAAAATAEKAGAKDLADTAAGQKVTAAFESILNTAPTEQQVNGWAKKIRAGHATVRSLDRYLNAESRTIASEKAAEASDPTVTVSPTGTVTVSGTGTGGASGLPSGAVTVTNPGTTGITAPTVTQTSGLTTVTGSNITNPVGLSTGVVGTLFESGLPTATVSSTGVASIVTQLSQIPAGSGITMVGGGVAPTTGVVGATVSNGTTALLAGTLVSGSGAAAGTTSSTSTSTTSPLGELLTTGTVPTPGLTTSTTPVSGTIGVPSALPIAPLPYSPLTFTPLENPVAPANSSPVPLDGTLPFTGTPANASPVSSNGTLVTTDTPANPSPVGLNGTLPTTDTPINPSPVPVTGTLF